MDNRPIGFFDSGLGGLTCIPNLLRELPDERVIYFGDTARTPYGSKAITTIQGFARQISDFLVEHDVKMIVIACNTVSATCLDLLRERHPEIPIIGVIEPAADRVSKTCSITNRVGVIGTKVTIASEAYKKAIEDKNPELPVFQQACPALVPLIEEGIIQNDIMDLTLEYYMDDFVMANRVDTIVLGCTHYPLIRSNIKRKYPNLRIINPSEEIVDSIRYTLSENDMLADNPEVESVFYASDLSENFRNMIDLIFGDKSVKTKFKSLEIDDSCDY